MNLRRLTIAFILCGLVCSSAFAQSAACRDAADEPHHQVVLESEQVRVLMLELPRLASTEPSCYAGPYVYIVLSEGKTSATAEGKGTFSHDWNGAESRFIGGPQKQVIRNESGNTFREIIVELHRNGEYHAFPSDYDADAFPGDLGTLKPTWTTYFTRGGVTFSKIQVAAGDSVTLNRVGHLLIALSDLTLQRRGHDENREVKMQAQELTNLSAGSGSELVNTGNRPARFLLIEY